MPNEVNSQSAAVCAMAEHWPMIEALVGGTGAMRKAGEKLLPKFPAEDPDSYSARLSTATLFPAFSRTTEVLAAKPFSKPVHVEGIDDDMEELLEDIAGEGVTLHAFSAGLFLECTRMGLSGVLVDMPPKPDGVRTKADEAAAGLRPYFAVYRAPSILGWRAEGDTLTQLRLLETVMEPDGEWGEQCVEQVRVLTPGAWATYRKVRGADGREVWRVHEEGSTTLDRIPFVFFYGIREGFGAGRPPLLDLAFMNVEHYQSSSDQQTILHTARVPLLFVKGLGEKEAITLGAGSFVRTTSADADMKFVEHSGAAIEAGRQSLLDLEDRMRQTGAELLVQRPNTATATQTVSETEGSKSILQRIVEIFEESLEECLELMGAWLGKPDLEVEVSLFKDFGATNLSDQSMTTLLAARQAGIVSNETAFKGLQRRDIIPSDIPWDEEQARIAGQPAPEEAEDLDEDGIDVDRGDPTKPPKQPPAKQPEMA
ncbi:DUF4055 domain-containing protein [Azospirillum sp. A26]|uniref:DUF4055 domain-containing protein n=1 Tax=Azospirillum sp. A26 TaxID=3160607 RepID=UPI00366BDBB8